MRSLAPKEYWGENGGYYPATTPHERHDFLLQRNSRWPFFRKMERIFFQYLPKGRNITLLEVGCGYSSMLPYFHNIFNYEISGIDNNDHAAKLARNNLVQNGVKGEIYNIDVFDRDASKELMASFDVIYSQGVIEHFDDAKRVVKRFREFLKEGGYIISSVPNFKGINYILQAFVDKRILDFHILHSDHSLVLAHEAAGFQTLFCGYIGVYDGWLTDGGRCKVAWKRRIHRIFCYLTNTLADRILRYTRYKIMPEFSVISPYILYIGKQKSPEKASKTCLAWSTKEKESRTSL